MERQVSCWSCQGWMGGMECYHLSMFILITASLSKLEVHSFSPGRIHGLLAALKSCFYSFWWKKETWSLWLRIDSECGVPEKLSLARLGSCLYLDTSLYPRGEVLCLRDMIMPVVKEVSKVCYQISRGKMREVLDIHKEATELTELGGLIMEKQEWAKNNT